MMYCWGARPDGSRYNPARLPSCVMLTATTNMEGSALSSMSRHIRLPVLVTLVAFTSAACGGRHSGFVAADPADIEQSLVFGAQGPRSLTVFVVDRWPAG